MPLLWFGLHDGDTTFRSGGRHAEFKELTAAVAWMSTA
jgi:hypothetical protein